MGSVAIVKFSRAICDNPVSQDEQIYKLLFHMNSVRSDQMFKLMICVAVQ